MYKETISQSAATAIRSMPANIQLECKSKINDLKWSGERFGLPLEDKFGLDLSGCYKIYFAESKYRIVYTMLSVNEVYILAVGKRRNLEAYYEAFIQRQRMNNLEQ